jgi:phage shock protein PspC (stress-responsive transcriptional regulator)
MEKVVSINLNGNAYQLDESAFDALRAYLARAEVALKDNPDKAEIIGDLEQAIAEKCAGYLAPGKSVIALTDMARALDEMGPVEDDDQGGDDEAPRASADAAAADGGAKANDGDKRARRLYRLPNGAMIAGVCNGLAAHFNIDPAIVRLAFILIAIVTHGFAAIGYIVLMFVIPSPNTPEEWAAAHNAPFNAQEVIERAKTEYQAFANNGGFQSRSGYRRARRAYRQARRTARWAAYSNAWRAPPYPAMAAGGVTNGVSTAIASLFALVFGLISAVFTIVFLVALFSLIATGKVLGWTPPGDLPLWALIALTCVIFAVLNSPFRAVRRATRYAMGGRGYVVHHAFDGIVWIGLLCLGGWLAYLYVPEAHAWLGQIPVWARDAWDTISANLHLQ